MSQCDLKKSFKVGEWIANRSLNLIERDGRSIRIEPRAMDVLAYLAAHPGEVASINELIEAVWQSNVTDGSVYRVINQLRGILEDNGKEQSYILTVPKRGYRLVAEVEFRHDTNAESEGLLNSKRERRPSLSVQLGVSLAAAIAVLLVGITLYRGDLRGTELSQTDAVAAESAMNVQKRPSIAVLPFENLSPDPENAFFAVGIHDSLIAELTKISAMMVISRPSVLHYADGQTPIQQIADELNVETIMKGTVQYTDDRIRIATQLIDPGTGVSIWSETYDRDFSDYFEIQADVASSIAMALQAQMMPRERESIERRPTDSPIAWATFLKHLSVKSNTQGLQFLNQAIELDPKFALAHTDKARRLILDLLTADEAVLIETERLVREHAQRALELDPNLGYAYVALAELHSRHWIEAEALAAFEQAIQLSPNNADVLMSFAFFDIERGQHQKAIEKAQAAVLLNPNHRISHYRLGEAYFFAKNLELAASVYLDTINRFPLDPWSYLSLAFIELMRANYSDVLTNISIAEELMGDFKHPGFLARLAYGYSRLGRIDDVLRILGELEAMNSSGQRIGAAQFGFAHLAAGNLEESLMWFNTAAETRDIPSGGNWITAVMKQNTFSDPLLDQPKWAEVRNKLGFR